jgi:hypothetical protein
MLAKTTNKMIVFFMMIRLTWLLLIDTLFIHFSFVSLSVVRPSVVGVRSKDSLRANYAKRQSPSRTIGIIGSIVAVTRVPCLDHQCYDGVTRGLDASPIVTSAEIGFWAF